MGWGCRCGMEGQRHVWYVRQHMRAATAEKIHTDIHAEIAEGIPPPTTPPAAGLLLTPARSISPGGLTWAGKGPDGVVVHLGHGAGLGLRVNAPARLGGDELRSAHTLTRGVGEIACMRRGGWCER